MSDEKETSLAREIRISDGKEGYDATCKALLAEKSILAHILKGCVDEVKDFTVQEIECMFDEEDVRIGLPLLPGETRAPAKVHVSQTEIKTNYESASYYDITFYLHVPILSESGEPKGIKIVEGHIKLYIDLEAQREYNMTYPIPKRGIYYGARGLSSQYEVEFKDSHYEDLKKVYSIWICLNCPPTAKNTISKYSIQKEDLVGVYDEPKKNYDMLTVVVIRLGKPGTENYSGLLKMLEVLLSDRDVETKKQILSEEYNIPMTEKIERSLVTMCNLSEEIEERGIERGYKTGKEDTDLSHIRNIMDTLGLTISQAMDALKIPKDKQPGYREMIKKV